MSGDVQPRKKKDKKRKKEEETSPSPPSHLFSKETSEDLNIHIHKEDGTGGGICAKIVFFILFSALIVLIGLIITEHRGLTDLDVAESDSKYSQIFEGWIDNDKHDDHHTLDDHDNDHFDDEEHEDDGHTLDDHDNDHIDDEETNEQSAEEHTLDDHDNEHFDDDQSSPPSEENEDEDGSQPEESKHRSEYTEKFRRNARYKREVSEEDDDDDNITESQEEQEDKSFNIYRNVKVETNDDEEQVDSKDEEDTYENITNDSENIYEEDEENSKEGDTVEDSVEIIEADDNSNDSTGVNDINEDLESDEEDDTKDNLEPSDEDLNIEYNSEDNDNTYSMTKKDDTVDTEDEDVKKGTVERVISKESDEENTSLENSDQVSEKINNDEAEKEFMKDSGEGHDGSSEKLDFQEKSASISSTEPNIIQENVKKVRDVDDEDDDHESDKSGGSDNPGSLSSKRSPSTELDDSDSEKLSDDNNEYEFDEITNKDDWPIRKELDEAQRNLPNNAANALKMFEKVLEKYPSSPRGLYGLAQALDALAEKEKSNELLEEAILNYFKVSELRNVPDPLYKTALERCIDRTRFRGKYGKAIKVHLKLINRFPDEPKYRNQLTITYLTIGKVEEARLLLNETLQKWPYNGCALVHYGFIWKTTENNLEKGAYFMQKGIDTKDPCVIDGRFYFHLGDSYSRLGDTKKALKIYEEGVRHKLFLSKYQRSLYNVPRLTARPWWQIDQLPHYKILFEDLEKHWITIRNEGLAVLNLNGYFQDESENLRDTGDWKQFELFARGRRNMKNCNKTPFTCKLIASHIDASGCRRGQTKFSVMHPGTHVWAHCGPTNCRLRIHLGLKVPSNTYIRVGDDIRSWKAGKLLIFDDSFEHEVWHNGTDVRLVLIVDVWHPELTMMEKETLSSL